MHYDIYGLSVSNSHAEFPCLDDCIVQGSTRLEIGGINIGPTFDEMLHKAEMSCETRENFPVSAQKFITGSHTHLPNKAAEINGVNPKALTELIAFEWVCR